MLLIMVVRWLLMKTQPYLSEKKGLGLWQMRYFAINSAVSGLMWGWAGILFYVPDNIELQLYVFIVLIFKGAGSVTAVTSYLPAFYLYFPTSMLPIIIRHFMEGTPTSFLLGIASLGYVAVMLYFGRNFNKTLVESLALRYENKAYLEQANVEKDRANQANLAKTKFLAAASHDLRQPLHALGLFTSILKDSPLNKQQSGLVDNMQKSLNSLEELLNALLDISKLDSDSVSVSKQHFNILSITKKLEQEFSIEAARKNLSLIMPCDDIYLFTDPVLTEQILRNLIANAIRYTEQGGVTIYACYKDERVAISVSDTGIGIPEDEQENIFQEFFQLSNKQRQREQGLGLGLAIVQRISTLLDANISIDSQPGKGSKFTLTLEAGEKASLKAHNTPSTGVPKPSKLSLKVAVLEDDQEAADSLLQLLEHWGCDVICGPQSQQLIHIMKEKNFNPQAIISDVQLSADESGVAAVQEIRKLLNANIPALYITGNVSIATDDLGDNGANLLYKPVAPAKLRMFLNNCARAC